MNVDLETIDLYDRRADDYAQFATTPVELALLDSFQQALPDGAYVLDLGCGPGHAAAAMSKAGLTVDATDASAEMVRLAARHTGISVRLESFGNLDAVGAYDGIWASFSLLHAARGNFPQHLQAIHRALRPGGLFFLGMKLGTGEKRDELGRFYTYYTEDELSTYLKQAGFTITARKKWQGKGLAGGVEPFIAITAHG